MGKVQCPYCKNISYVPSKSEGQESPCVACGRLFVKIAFAETTQQQEAQDIKAYHESTAYPKPRETVPALIIDKGEANGNVESISKQQLSRSTQRAEQSSAPKSYRVDVSDYSGFWRRVAAHLIDGIVLLPMAFLLPALEKGLMVEGLLATVATGTFAPLVLAYFLNLVIILLMLVIYWLYFAKMHSSNKQATFGKMVMGVTVIDTNGNRMSFARASGRHFATILSALTLCIGFVMAAFTERKQALHDKIAGTLVVKSDMNSSFKYKRTFVKLVLIYLGIFLFSIACSYLTYHAKYSKLDKLKVPVEQLTEKVTSIFVMPEALGDFEVLDVTSYVRTMNPNARIIYCVNWTIDKEHSKKWDGMNQNEKDEFIKLKNSVVEAFKSGVHSLNGTFEVHDNKFTNGENGEWKLTDPKYSFPIWWVNYTFNPKSFDTGTPRISIFIKHSQVDKD